MSERTRVHVVCEGECLATIADTYGVPRVEDLHRHPDNAELRDRRPSPTMLHPGDTVIVPIQDPHRHPIAPGGTHRFQAAVRHVWLCLRLKHEGAILASEPYRLSYPGRASQGTSDGDGMVEVEVPVQLRSVELVLERRNVTFHVQIGALPPYDTPRGVGERLRNLGFSSLPPGTDLAHLVGAIARFRAAAGLPAEGGDDAAFRAALRDAHGS